MILIGKIVKAQGIKGEVKVKPITSDINRFKVLEYAIIENNMREFLKNEKHFTMPTKQEEIKYQKYVEWLGALGRDERVKHLKEHGHEPYVYMKYPK